MIKLKCFFAHKWSKWEHVDTFHDILGKPDKLERECTKCGKKDTYIGMTDVCIITGYLTPYIFKGS